MNIYVCMYIFIIVSFLQALSVRVEKSDREINNVKCVMTVAKLDHIEFLFSHEEPKKG